MRILQIVPSISLVYGGPSQMIRGLAAALAAAGAEVTVLTTDSNGDTGQPPLEVPLDRPVAQDGYQIRYFRCSPFRRYKFSLELLRWLATHAAEFDLAHIHALFSPVSTIAARVCRHQGLPYILRPLGTLDPADLRKKRRLKQVYAALLERPNLAGAAAVHFTSAQECRISERFGVQTHDRIIPLGVSLPPTTLESAAVKAKLGIPEGVPLVLFMSRLDPKKGFDLLQPALLQLLDQAVPFHFVLAGSNPQDPTYEAQVEAMFTTSPLAPHTTIAGFVSGELKTGLLQAADLFVLPSYYENFGIAVAEAMAAGVPVVISDQVHIWEEVQQAEAGWVCPCAVDPLVEQLRAALQDLPECRRRGQQARTYALEHYSWPAIARKMLQTYQEILNQHTSH
ncbi:glycosyl transferase group 1 [Leptolyngbya sp. 'hensonii']|uniref:hormogonium polysaccharide biosynthesis glycosyltransferase HpsP n=1 Tax=Leptolyngbya sp. 'hensonii' TaxID=1922337 RepID=UPI00094FACF9|nr:hormogonium polysaccharide biosynthesis glycosyltransferase HpsP [Leptolyngbya sp. 'hensonii']OLP19608.1 glycosyl transferase group 1 [Leptolyngbya sp. 'hensonii']